MHKIVYLQANDKIAESFQEEFLKQDIEMEIVKSGEEALSFIKKEKVLLLLLDINIPDMRFRKLVDRIREVSPQVIINVCVDVLDPLMITKLSNRHHVHKIYVAPWDVDQIVEEVKESIEVAIINEQSNIREEKINSDTRELEETIESLTNKLKRQQHSYTKITTLTDCFTKALMEDEGLDLKKNDRIAFATDVYTSILKMHTTGSFDIDKYEDSIKKELKEIKGIASGFSIGSVESCLFGDQSRSHAQNIKFCIFLIARLYGQFYDTFKISVSSHFITTREAEFVVTIEGAGRMIYGSMEDFEEYKEYVMTIIQGMTSNADKSKEGENDVYHMTFPVTRE